MPIEKKYELTTAGQALILLGSIMLILGLAIENYVVIIPGLFLLLIVTSTFVSFFYFQDLPEVSFSVSKDYVRNRGLIAVVAIITNTGTRTLTFRVTLNYSYHFNAIEIPETCFIQLAPNEKKRVGWYLLAIRRGNAEVGPISISHGFFQQIFVNKVTFDDKIQIKVLPHRPKIHVPWKTKKDLLMQLVNQFAQRVKGQGTEFYSLRNYLPGDEMKHIDWRATARHDKLITREYEDERQLHFLIFLDLGSTMFGPKFDYALSSVVELCSLIRGSNHDLAVIAYSDVVERFVVPQVGIQEFKLMLNLYDLEASGVQSDFFEAVKFAKTQQLYHSVAIIFSDLDGDLTKKLSGLNTLQTMGAKIIFVNFSTMSFNILASKDWLIAKAPTFSYSEILGHVFPSLVKDEYKQREIKVRNILRAVGGDFVTIQGYLDNIIFALYRLMKKYSPRQRIISEAVRGN
ncbi:MAG: DUF58 domain-containing protein [Candidatus Heimdallarchaeaceae archaeon]